MAELASLQIKVVRDGIEQAQKALSDLAKAADAAEKGAGGVGKSFEDANAKTKSFGSEVMGLAKKFAGLYVIKQAADAMIGFAGSALKARGAMEQNEIALTTMLGSASKAAALIQKIQIAAKETPFEQTELISGAKSLIAFGESAETVVDSMKMLGDVAAGVSIPIGELIVKYGQIRTQQVAYTQDLKEFAGRGIPIFDELAKVMGKTTPEIKAMASEGKIGFAQIEAAFRGMTGEGGKFHNLMQAQSKSLVGMVSNLSDAYDILLNKIGSGMEDNAKRGVGALGSLLSEGGLLNDALRKIGNVADWAIGKIADMLQNVDDSYRTANGTSNDFAASIQEINQYLGEGATEMGFVDNFKRAVKESFTLKNYIWGMSENTEELVGKQKQYQQYLEMGYKSWTEMEKAVQSYQDTIESGRLPGANGGGAKTNNTPSKNSGIPAWVKDQQFLQSILNNTGTDIDKLNAKYQEQFDKIDKIKGAYGKSSETYKMAIRAELELNNQRSEAIKESWKQLKTFDSVLKSSLIDGLINIFDITTEKGTKAASVMGDLIANLASSAITAGVSAFETLGEALGKGASSAKAFKQAMAAFAEQLLRQLPMMFVQAGLMAIVNGQMALGLGLIAAGLSSAVISGFVQGKKDENETANAHGNVYGFASGGSFANEVINSPTRFMFSKGAGLGKGLMGESGPEAIVPLKRMGNGDLGIQSNGSSSGTIVNVYNYSKEEATVNESEGADGSRMIEVIIGQAVNNQISQGVYDRSLKGRYRLNPTGG